MTDANKYAQTVALGEGAIARGHWAVAIGAGAEAHNDYGFAFTGSFALSYETVCTCLPSLVYALNLRENLADYPNKELHLAGIRWAIRNIAAQHPHALYHLTTSEKKADFH